MQLRLIHAMLVSAVLAGAPLDAIAADIYSAKILYPATNTQTGLRVLNTLPPGISSGIVDNANFDRTATIWDSTGAATSLDAALLPNNLTTSVGQYTDGQYVVGFGLEAGLGSKPQSLLWNPSTNAVMDLAPDGSLQSSAVAVNHGQVVGWASYTSNLINHGMLWTRNGASWAATDLTPSAVPGGHLAAPTASVLQTDGSRQVGSADVFAAVWSGSAASFVNLGPTNVVFSSAEADGICGSQIVGNLRQAGGNTQPLLWTALNTTPIDLLPSGALSAYVYATNGSQQVGYSNSIQAGIDAVVWNGTADWVTDLSQFLPAGFSGGSIANSIDSAGNIFGTANKGADGFVVEWSPVPEPGGVTVIALCGLILRRTRTSNHKSAFNIDEA